MAAQPVNIDERIKEAASVGDIERLYELIREDPKILGHFDELPFCETPLHIAAEKGQTHFAMELMTLKPSLALKLNPSGLSPIHLALKNNHFKTARGFVAINNSLVSIMGRGRITPLHYVARKGHSELLSEFLFACPSSIEDLTIRCETVVHIAIKNRQLLTFKVLLGWIQRAHKEEILDWKDEDGNTALHIAASINQHEIMKLLRRTVKLKAKNLAGMTAMDILQTFQSPRSKASRLFQSVKEKLVLGPTMNLVGYLREKPSLIEKQNKLFGVNHLFHSSHISLSSNDSRSVVLVVAILIVTATYQAGLSPPGGYWQENSLDTTKDYENDDSHKAGQMTMPLNHALAFYILNAIAFFSSLYVIMILIVGLPMWMVLYGSTAALAIGNYASLVTTLPNPNSPFGEIAVSLLPAAYPIITGLILSPPVVAFFMNTRRRYRVDFPKRYFTKFQELS